jgi:hypothetical protein
MVNIIISNHLNKKRAIKIVMLDSIRSLVELTRVFFSQGIFLLASSLR